MKLKLMLVFLSIMLIFSTSSCDLTKAKSKKAKPAQVSKANPSQEAKTQYPTTDPIQKDNSQVKSDSIKSSETPRRTTSYARENPFIPLISEQSRNNPKTTSEKAKEKEEEKKPEPSKVEKPPKEITIRLNGVIAGSMAFFSEDGVNKTYYIGETISGMKILEINSGEVVLNKDNMRYKIKTGEQIKIKVPQQ